MINSTNISNVFKKKKRFCYSELSNEDYSLIFNIIDNHFKKLLSKTDLKTKNKINLKKNHSL